MLTAKNPECSRCCRFVGTQFESGRDYGEHGMGSTVWGARYGEHGMGSTEQGARQMGARRLYSSVVERVTCNHKVSSSILDGG